MGPETGCGAAVKRASGGGKKKAQARTRKTGAKKTATKLKIDRGKRVRELARERVGEVKPSRAIPSKLQQARRRRKPKHKRPPEEENGE